MFFRGATGLWPLPEAFPSTSRRTLRPKTCPRAERRRPGLATLLGVSLYDRAVGAWGTAIFSDDTAADVRDEWRDAILAGLTAEDATAHQRHKRPEELDPIIAAFDWYGGRVPKRPALARLPLVADPLRPEEPEPLIIAISTHMKKDVFGPHLGEVIASGVTVDVALDPEYVRRYMGWRLVASAVQEAQLMARWRATPEGRR